MNNEPVTYLKKDESTGLYYECDKEYGFPVYAHPIKELTDEEIADFLYAYCLDMGDVYEASEEQFIKCVRAILKKAQE